MEVRPSESFEMRLEALKQKPLGRLKSGDIRQLIKSAGPRLGDEQSSNLIQLLANRIDASPIVFDLLGELETSTSPNSRLVPLRSSLWGIVGTWVSQPLPSNQDDRTTTDWIQAQLTPAAEGQNKSSDRIRAVLLWLVAQHRNPEFFLHRFIDVGRLATKSKSRKASIREAAPGFLMASLAKAALGVGHGTHPKLTKLGELAAVARTVLDHLHERASAADDALRKSAEREGMLAEQQRLNREHELKVGNLEHAKTQLDERNRWLDAEVGRLTGVHQQAIDHTEAQVAEAQRAQLTDIRAKLDPKLKDARLYLDRPNPAVAQAVRLLTEVEEILKSRETKP